MIFFSCFSVDELRQIRFFLKDEIPWSFVWDHFHSALCIPVVYLICLISCDLEFW